MSKEDGSRVMPTAAWWAELATGLERAAEAMAPLPKHENIPAAERARFLFSAAAIDAYDMAATTATKGRRIKRSWEQ